MFEFVRGIGSYVYDLVYPQPPSNAAYGFRWRRGQGVPNALTIYDLNADDVPPGVYVAFTYAMLEPMIDFFGQTSGVGTVYPRPGAPSAAVTAMVGRVRRNPPPNEADYWANVPQSRLRDLSGFLAYTANCLDLIDQTAAGHQLLQTLDGGRYAVFISPAALGNQTSGAADAMTNDITRIIIAFESRQPIDAAAVRSMIEQKYADVRGTLAKYNRLADEMNNLPLCSLFVDEANFRRSFLYSFFRFRGRRFTGQNLVNWLSENGFAAFNGELRAFARTEQGVLVRQYFLMAMAMLLHSASPAGAGAGAGIKFNVRRENDNDPGDPSFRPPAIGLSHELMHAMHYTRGTAAGADFGHFTTTAAELLFVGITPFQNEPVTENAIRAQWHTVANPDGSNAWPNPTQRTTYEPPGPQQTPEELRGAFHCI